MQKIGIIVAMQEEEEAIKLIMEDIQIEQIYNLKFLKGTIHGKECILVQSGVGKVNSARTTQIMTDIFKPNCILNLGAAGAINDKLNIGDILIGKYTVQHDFDITAFKHPKGYISGIGDKILCDEKIIEQFQDIIKKRSNEKNKVKLGVVATGDIFCTSIDMKEKIRNEFNADVVDMECGAIAQVCYLNNIPFAVVRGISDTPNGENAGTFDKNLEFASKQCSDILNDFLLQL